MLKIYLPLKTAFEFENASVTHKDQGGFTLRIPRCETTLPSFLTELSDPRNMVLDVDGRGKVEWPVKLVKQVTEEHDLLLTFRIVRNGSAPVSGTPRDGGIVAPPLK